MIDETLKVINVDWDCDVKYLIRDKNLGCKVAMSSAITWFFEHEEQGIVIEDDCWADVTFFRFCEELLEKYKDDTRVMHICGCSDIENYNLSNYKYSYFFSKVMGCWGWASWRRAWKYFDIDMSDFELFKEENAIDMYYTDEAVKKEYIRVWSIHAAHKQTSWAWIYQYNLRCQNALCINPAVNLVKNIGANTPNSAHYQTNAEKMPNVAAQMQFPLKHPVFMGIRNKIFKEESKFLKTLKNIAKNIFSYTNSPNTSHRVCTIFGIKMKFQSNWFLKKKINKKIVISLVSHPERINTVNIAINSLLRQSYRADKIALWLCPEQFPNKEKDLPNFLIEMQKNGIVEIGWHKNLGTHTKLVPSLLKYPDCVIITADDSVIYPGDMVKNLVQTHVKYPDCIVANRANYAVKENKNKLISYIKHKREVKFKDPSFNFILSGAGGVLYPPSCFNKDVLNEKLLAELSQNSGDTLFWSKVLPDNIKIKLTNTYKPLIYIYGG